MRLYKFKLSVVETQALRLMNHGICHFRLGDAFNASLQIYPKIGCIDDYFPIFAIQTNQTDIEKQTIVN